MRVRPYVLRRFAATLVAVVSVSLLVTGLAGAGSAVTASGPQTFTVDVDGHNPKANENFLAYFPRVVRVHAGDTVVFHNVGNGEPHTATLGSLADTAVSAFAHLTPAQQNNPPKTALAADAAVPQLLPQGPGDAIQASANRCFVPAGELPGGGLCPNSQHAQPDFNGSQTFYNSGWLDSNAKFTVHLSSSTPPGSYSFMCLLHREFMSGKVVVEPSSTPVASPAAQYAAGQKVLASDEAQLASAVTAERQGQLPLPGLSLPPNSVLAGSGSPTAAVGAITEFGPKTVKIPVGGSVTWWVIGPHSITFNSNKTNDDIRAVAPDGTIHANGAALAPAGGPGEPATPPKGGSQTNPKFQVVASSSWNGRGFHSSGVFDNSFGPPLIEGYRLKFTRAGTYNYICTVHDNMKGKVVVGKG
jgi:plastocyanin